MTETLLRTQEANVLYERYGKPLERDHLGQYIGIAKDGATVLAPTLAEVMRKALEAFGPGAYVFKLGQHSVGKWR